MANLVLNGRSIDTIDEIAGGGRDVKKDFQSKKM
jgi:hypothetical protein